MSPEDVHRLVLAEDSGFCDDALCDVFLVREVEHDVFHHALHDRAQAAGAGVLAHCDLGDLAGMIPGMDAKALKGAKMDDKLMARQEAIILSMTKAERQNPAILNSSRKKRIAAGSGTSVVDVNRLLKQYDAMQQMVKQLSGKNMKKLQKKMGRMGGGGGFPGMGGGFRF